MDRFGGAFDAQEAQDHLDDFVEDDAADLDPPPSPVGQDERRMQVRAYNHWASLLGDANYPDIEDLEPELLDDFGPYSVLLDFTSGVENPAVRFVGDELRAECDVDGELTHLEDVPPRSLLSRITDHYLQIIANEAPIGFEAEFVNQRGLTILYRGILLPYSSNNETIDFIFGVINWKELADAKTADELLLQIDQALAGEDDHDDGDENDFDDVLDLTQPEENLSAEDEGDWGEDEVFELGSAEIANESVDDALPTPGFGDRGGDDLPGRKERGVDALGNPLGSLAPGPGSEDADMDGGDFDSGMKTAADYGLPDWDDEDFEEDDVDDLVDPLGDEEAGSSLMSLVSRGEREKKTVDLTGFSASPTQASLPIPQAYDREEASESFQIAAFGKPETVETYDEAEEAVDAFDDQPEAVEHEDEIEAGADVESIAVGTEEISELPVPTADAPIVTEAAEDAAVIAAAEEVAPEGLYDCLAAARELAQAAQSTEDRSRKALYAAVGLAYDFSLEAQNSPEDFGEIIADNGLTVQDRAPMTPIVKLVFGADYDKTRLTEYAAVLTHAHRVGIERGHLADFLREAEGGLKGVVQAERRARKEEQGKPVEDDGKGIRAALAKKLRAIEPSQLDEIAEEGPEFALVMVRRTETGELVVVGELEEDRPLLEKAARKLLAK